MKDFPNTIVPVTFYPNYSGVINDLSKGLCGTYWKNFGTSVAHNLSINRETFSITSLPGEYETEKHEWNKLGKADEEAIVGISINHSWNKTTRKISGTIDVEFSEVPRSNDLSIALFVVEDSVIGGDCYDQATNFWYHGDYPEIEEVGELIENKDSCHNLDNTFWIRDYAHRWVFRESLFENDFWGKTDAFANIEVGKKYSIPFEHTLPVDYWDLPVVDDQIYLSTFVAIKDSDKKGEVLNAEMVNLADATGLTQPKNLLQTSNSINITVSSPEVITCFTPVAMSAKVSIISASGKKIASFNKDFKVGVNNISIPENSLASGVYYFNFDSRSESITKRFVISQ